ncbi:molybdenum cofactor biosynthesis protein B [Duganella sp. CT11-25]|jgi:molybdenum cofactor biosynthesis protein B|uniref:molybdenum cofactor biosynthesis protein B n=1 Tax=unclassified Duganella TaxID=2636909 RepID=UPI0039AE987D
MADPVSLRCVVLTISASRTAADDSSGDLLAQRLQAAGHQLVRRAIVTDNLYEIRRVLSDCIAGREVQVVLMNGGTGYAANNVVPEAVLPLLDREVPGFGELMRQLSYADIGTSALQARALAGFANGKLIFCLPGSTGACALAWDGILAEQLDSRHKPCNFASRLGVNA